MLKKTLAAGCVALALLGPKMAGADEFSEIARLFRPLTGGTAGAFDLKDDAAVVRGDPRGPSVDAVDEGLLERSNDGSAYGRPCP